MQNQKIKQNKKITISFTNSDDDLIEYLEGLKKENKASEFIREAIREKMQKINYDSKINEQIIKELKDITKKIQSIEKSTEDSFSDNLVVSKENRFASPKKEENNETIGENKKESGDELGEALDFFDF